MKRRGRHTTPPLRRPRSGCLQRLGGLVLPRVWSRDCLARQRWPRRGRRPPRPRDEAPLAESTSPRAAHTPRRRLRPRLVPPPPPSCTPWTRAIPCSRHRPRRAPRRGARAQRRPMATRRARPSSSRPLADTCSPRARLRPRPDGGPRQRRCRALRPTSRPRFARLGRRRAGRRTWQRPRLSRRTTAAWRTARATAAACSRRRARPPPPPPPPPPRPASPSASRTASSKPSSPCQPWSRLPPSCGGARRTRGTWPRSRSSPFSRRASTRPPSPRFLLCPTPWGRCRTWGCCCCLR